MDKDLNFTFISFDGHLVVYKYRYLYFVIMLSFYIQILCSNFSIVYIIVMQKSLHEPMYVFIAALLLNSVFFSTVVYPKLLIDFVSERQITSYPACLFQFLMFYSLGGTQFLLLAAMAYDRYVAICKPLQYPIIMRKTTVSIFIILSWILPICQVLGTTIINANTNLCNFSLKGFFCDNTLYKLLCVSLKTQTTPDIIILFNVAVLPLLFIFFSYARILQISYRSCGEVRKKAAQTCLPHLVVLICFSVLCLYDVISGLESSYSNAVNVVMTLQIVTYPPLLNPIIYGVKMKEISKHLKRLFCTP